MSAAESQTDAGQFVPDGHKVRMCHGRSAGDNRPENFETTVAALAKRILQRPAPLPLTLAELTKEAKAALPYILGGPSDLVPNLKPKKNNDGTIAMNDDGTTITVEGGWRGAENIRERDVVTLDFDEATSEFVADMEKGHGPLAGLELIAHTTVSATVTNKKLRVLLFPPRPLSPTEHRLVVDGLIDLVREKSPAAYIDPTCGDVNHIMFAPAMTKDGIYEPFRSRGAYLDIEGLIARATRAAHAKAEHEEQTAQRARHHDTLGDDATTIRSRWRDLMVALGISIQVSPRKKSEWTTCCVWHDDTHPSLDITGDGLMICRSCGASGSILDLVMQVRNCDIAHAFAFAREALGMPPRMGSNASRSTQAGASTVGADAPWPEPEPLPSDCRPPSLYDDCGDGAQRIDAMLPADLARFVRTTAQAGELSPESVLAGALPAAALAVGPDVIAHGNREHRETLSLWVMSVEPPGSRKSAAFSTATAPLGPLEEQMAKQGSEAHSAWRSREAARSRELSSLDKKLSCHFDAVHVTGDDKKRLNSFALDNATFRIAEIERARAEDIQPGRMELQSSNATPEAVVERVAASRCFGALSAEGATIIEGLAEYREGDDGSPVGYWCGLYSGDRVSVARKGSDSIVIKEKSAILCCGLTVQPDVLERARERRTLVRRGFLARFIKLVPRPVEIGRGLPPPIDQDAVNWWTQAITAVSGRRPARECEVGCTPEAARLLREFEVSMRNRALDADDLGVVPALAEFARKAHGSALRLAAVFHALEGQPYQEPIDAETMLRGIAVMFHALDVEVALVSQSGDSKYGKLRRLLARIAEAKDKNGGPLTEVRPRLVARMGWAGLTPTGEALAALRELAEFGWLREVQRQNPGGGPKQTVFLVHPRLSEKISTDSADNTDKTFYPDSVPESFVGFVGFVGKVFSQDPPPLDDADISHHDRGGELMRRFFEDEPSVFEPMSPPAAAQGGLPLSAPRANPDAVRAAREQVAPVAGVPDDEGWITDPDDDDEEQVA